MDPVIYSLKTNLKWSLFQAAELLITCSVAVKNTSIDTEISTFSNVCVLATTADTSCWPVLTWQWDSCACRDAFGTFTGSSTRGDLHAHAHRHTYAPFRGDNNPLSIQGKKNIFISLQWHVLCKMSLQQCI